PAVVSKRALFIVNRHSRAGMSDLSAAQGVLRERGIGIVERSVESAEDVGETIRAGCREVDLVILAGGDGTMNAAADALAECGLPLGILPTGTGNDLARTLGIPTSLAEAAAVIADGQRHAIDLGRVNGKHFFNVASIGLAAELTRHHTVERKRRFWLFAYVLSVSDAFRATRPFRARLRCDGRERELHVIQISIGNGRHYGGGMTISEDAAIDDGMLDVYCLKPLSLWRLMTLLPSLRSGRLGRQSGALAMRGRAIEVSTRRPMPINTDGELTTRTPATFTVVPGAVSIFVPSSHAVGREAMADAAQ
ncbi:MAG: lipid kinase, partial [Geminicoccaceae bacterium]